MMTRTSEYERFRAYTRSRVEPGKRSVAMLRWLAWAEFVVALKERERR